MNLSDFYLLTNWAWLSNSRPISSGFWLSTVLIITLLALVVSFVFGKYYRPEFKSLLNLKNSWIKLINYCAFFSLVVLFGRWQQLPFLGMRLLHVLIGAVFILVGVFLIILRLTRAKKQIRQKSIENKLNEYLPKIKK